MGEHDHRLVLLAASVCALASLSAVRLLTQAERSGPRWRAAWLAIAGVAGGSGVWATHFIAMLAYEPGLPSGYTVGLTVLSLAYAVGTMGAGLALALRNDLRAAPWVGGTVVGLGIAVMHYTGMAAFQVAGRIAWNWPVVVVSILAAAAPGGLALRVTLGGRGTARRLGGAALLMLAICAHHFIGMGAVVIRPDPTVDVSAVALPASWMALAVALASATILLLAAAALALEGRERRRVGEAERLRSLANAAVEGLVVCRGERIVSANDSFAKLVGAAAVTLDGRSLLAFLPGEAGQILAQRPDHLVEAELRRIDGSVIPVELIVRPISSTGQPHYAVAVRDLRARRVAERKIQFMALHDPLTGLANRAGFNERIEQDLRLCDARGERLAVLCLDLDRFKEVNDLFGHATGDKLLKDVARIVTGVIGERMLMSRLGGDEFAILARVDDPAAAGQLADRILRALRAGNRDQAGPLIATSIGVALYPDDATTAALLLNNADTALYRAKSEGRDTYRFYETRMGAEVRGRRVLEHDLRHAASRGELHLVYQPQTRIDTGAVLGFEALLRWDHPERGAIPPSTFIPVAEESGLILPLGLWVLNEACREAAGWAAPLRVAVNVSAVQVHAPQFAAQLRGVLARSGLAPQRLEIEITETALIRDPVRALATLRQVKALGVRLPMDDFGTGYSSLSNLRTFPFDKIKIDGSFIKAVDTNAQTAAIVRSVLGLGRGLGLPVLAEGVETAGELGFLKDADCGEAQGYGIARPGPIESFADWTRGRLPDPLAKAA